MHVARLDKSFEKDYEQFLMNNTNGPCFVSNGYRKLLREFIHGEDHYLIALNDTNEIIGTLPSQASFALQALQQAHGEHLHNVGEAIHLFPQCQTSCGNE